MDVAVVNKWVVALVSCSAILAYRLVTFVLYWAVGRFYDWLSEARETFAPTIEEKKRKLAAWLIQEDLGVPPLREEPDVIATARSWAEYLHYWMLTPVVVILVMCVFRRSLRRTIMHMRGIHFEAMQPGSDFVDGEIPDFQVGIYNAGAFVDTFVGYGVRFGTMLVVPTHVVRHAREMVIEGKTGKIGVSVAPMQSRVHSDVTYFPLTDQQWSRVGVSQARVPKKLVNALVNCTGRRGTTSGMISRVEALGILKYAGSTVGGMSGAAYYSGQMVHGIHTGCAGAFNVGVSSLLIASEVKKLVVGETPTLDEMRGLNRAASARTKFGWDTAGLMKQIDEIYSRDSEWAEDVELDYGAQLDFEAEDAEESQKWLEDFVNMPLPQQQSAVAAMQGIINAKRTAKGQSDGPSASVTLPKDFVTLRFEALEKRMDNLETRVNAFVGKQKVKQPNPGAKANDSNLPYLCAFEGEDEQGKWKCRKGFSTEAARLQHRIMTGHVKVEGESAFGGDVRVPVATRPVFRKRPVSPIWNSKSWKSTSNSVEQVNQSTSPIVNQSSTQEFPVQTLKSLVESLQDMVGRLSVTTQNCKA